MKNNQILIILSAGQGYKKEIFMLFERWQGVDYHIVHFDSINAMHNALSWTKIGQLYRNDEILAKNINDFKFAILPFLDIGTLAKIAVGINDTIDTQLIQNLLIGNIPCYAFDYHCRPQSELNELMLAGQNHAYNSVITTHMKTVETFGLQFIKPEELFNNHLPSKKMNFCHQPFKKYITLEDVIKNNITDLTLMQHYQFTDLAIEYIKNKKGL